MQQLRQSYAHHRSLFVDPLAMHQTAVPLHIHDVHGLNMLRSGYLHHKPLEAGKTQCNLRKTMRLVLMHVVVYPSSATQIDPASQNSHEIWRWRSDQVVMAECVYWAHRYCGPHHIRFTPTTDWKGDGTDFDECGPQLTPQQLALHASIPWQHKHAETPSWLQNSHQLIRSTLLQNFEPVLPRNGWA